MKFVGSVVPWVLIALSTIKRELIVGLALSQVDEAGNRPALSAAHHQTVLAAAAFVSAAAQGTWLPTSDGFHSGLPASGHGGNLLYFTHSPGCAFHGVAKYALV
jgi:hypothetical protein